MARFTSRWWVVALLGAVAALIAAASILALLSASLAQDWAEVERWASTDSERPRTPAARALLVAAKALGSCSLPACNAARRGQVPSRRERDASRDHDALPLPLRDGFRAIDDFYRTRSDLAPCYAVFTPILLQLGLLRLGFDDGAIGSRATDAVYYLAQRMRTRGRISELVFGALLSAKASAWLHAQAGHREAYVPGAASRALPTEARAHTLRRVKQFGPSKEELFSGLARAAVCDYRFIEAVDLASGDGLLARARRSLARYAIVASFKRLRPRLADLDALAVELREIQASPAAFSSFSGMESAVRVYARLLAPEHAS
ncbi:MAG: hypothetical protein IPL40_12915 [Proteobacteria bacterium]|nr:hypothetical protein [Pseudomonadota bacterium]